MKALIFIALQNIKKKKGDAVVFFFLIALAALLLYTSISVFMGMDTILDNAYDKAHTADLFYMSNVAEEQIKEIMISQEEVTEYEASDCIYLLETEYRKEGEENNQGQFFFGIIEDERKIGKLVGAEDADINEDSLLLPYYMQAAAGYSVGDIVYFTFGEEEYQFQVASFVEDPLFATPLNISVYGSYISNSRMETLLEENSTVQAAKYVQHKVRLREGEDSFEFDKKLIPLFTQGIPELAQTSNLGVNWGSMKGGVAMMSRISMGIVLVFSMLLILVVLIIIRFSIRNYIEMNLKNVGILQAAGYTSWQLNFTVLIEMGLISGVGALVGILLGLAGNSIIGKFQGIMLGLQWRQTFHPIAACVAIIVVLAVVLGVSFICGGIYRKITVLESLRGGIHTHNFKKNYFAFDKSRLSIPFTLAAKNLFHEKAKNISIFCIVVILAFAASVGFGLYENFAVSNDNLMKLVGAEAGDILIAGENMEAIGAEMESFQEVEKVLYYNNTTVQLESKEDETAVTCDIWDAPELLEYEMIVRGRLPKYENEIVLTTSVAEQLSVDVGDTIYVTGQDERMDYIICGIDQKINNMGLKAMMTQKAAVRLNGSSPVMYLYVYTEEGISYEEISEKVMDHFPNVTIAESQEILDNMMNGVTMAMIAI
ncbi:MAG: ABC transporter permease, partial [Eubacterium sp.]|nr:ABC transporter permease [Eubacterium sp.]